MEFHDPVYGTVSVREPVIEELVLSAPMQRLKGINQAGAMRYVNPGIYRNTRFEHSMGVYYLLRRFNSSLEEQIAGLLHDVSHTAFSHVVDYLFEGGAERQDYHETIREKVIAGSEIPGILERNGVSVKNVMDERRFGLLERPLPDICADRLDYFFRDAVAYKLSNTIRQDTLLFVSGLRVFRGEFVFSNIELARKAALTYMECGLKFWSNAMQAASFKMLADAIRLAMKDGTVSQEDLMLTDDALHAKLSASKNPEVQRRLKLLPGLDKWIGGARIPRGLATKARCINPKVLQNGRARRLSEYESGYGREIERFSNAVKTELARSSL